MVFEQALLQALRRQGVLNTPLLLPMPKASAPAEADAAEDVAVALHTDRQAPAA